MSLDEFSFSRTQYAYVRWLECHPTPCSCCHTGMYAGLCLPSGAGCEDMGRTEGNDETGWYVAHTCQCAQEEGAWIPRDDASGFGQLGCGDRAWHVSPGCGVLSGIRQACTVTEPAALNCTFEPSRPIESAIDTRDRGRPERDGHLVRIHECSAVGEAPYLVPRQPQAQPER